MKEKIRILKGKIDGKSLIKKGEKTKKDINKQEGDIKNSPPPQSYIFGKQAPTPQEQEEIYTSFGQ